MEINVNNKIFTKNIFKNKSRRKGNFLLYHFLEESKPHDEYLPDKNNNKKKDSNKNENMIF